MQVTPVFPGDHALAVQGAVFTTDSNRSHPEDVRQAVYQGITEAKAKAGAGLKLLHAAEEVADDIAVGAKTVGSITAKAAKTVQKVAGRNALGSLAGAVAGLATVAATAADKVHQFVEPAKAATEKAEGMLIDDPSLKRPREGFHFAPQKKAAVQSQVNEGFMKAVKKRSDEKADKEPAVLRHAHVVENTGDLAAAPAARTHNAPHEGSTGGGPSTSTTHVGHPVHATTGTYYHTNVTGNPTNAKGKESSHH